MDTNLIALLCIGLLLVAAIFILPQRKLPDEKGAKLLHSERCFAYWKAFGGLLVSGANFPARVSFYEKFFVVSRITLAKFYYSDIKSASFRRNWFSRSAILNFSDGRSLILSPRNIDKVRSLIEPRIHKK